MNIFRYEFKMYRKSIITWALSIAAILIMYMAFYPSFGADVEMMDKLLENYPEELLKAFGMGGSLSLSSISGFLAFTFTFVQLCLAIQASNYGFSILSVEERELTADFLMSKPVSRNTILFGKFFAAFIALTITNIAVWICTYISLALYNNGSEYDSGAVAMLLASNMLIQLFFMSVGMVISVSAKKIRSVLSFSMALSFGAYMINAIRGIIDSKLLGYITPFYHFEPNGILEFGKINWSLGIISLVIIVGSLVATYVLYNNRNIHSL